MRDSSSGYFGTLLFEAGVSQRPAEGVELQRLVAAIGSQLAKAEPWDEAPAEPDDLAVDVEVVEAGSSLPEGEVLAGAVTENASSAAEDEANG